jgi:hypothetical protein
MWFRYERFLSGWSPVVIHDRDKPGAPSRGEASESWPVPDTCKDEHGEPLFGALQKLFPPPAEASE